MIVTEKIQKQAALLPESLQTEVLHFVEYLLYRAEASGDEDEIDVFGGVEWSRTSIAMAMRGMEEDDEPEYTLADLQGVF